MMLINSSAIHSNTFQRADRVIHNLNWASKIVLKGQLASDTVTLSLGNTSQDGRLVCVRDSPTKPPGLHKTMFPVCALDPDLI